MAVSGVPCKYGKKCVSCPQEDFQFEIHHRALIFNVDLSLEKFNSKRESKSV
jgi:hypothetical protein